MQIDKMWFKSSVHTDEYQILNSEPIQIHDRVGFRASKNIKLLHW